MLFLGWSVVYAQNKYTLSGTIKDAANGETMIGATVYVVENKIGTATNLYGFYSIQLPEGNYTIQYSLIGYQTKTIKVNLNKDIKQDIELSEIQTTLNEVEITSEREDANVKSVEMSVQKLDIKTINKIPALLGEVDIIRSIQLLPGVTTVGEGASGFNVRGGGVDQNLILLDEAPVYNSSHLFGFFSVFNPDAVKDVKLVKGGIPAQYGGRLSSLLDIRMKEGNNKRFEVNGGIGTIFSRLTIEGPIIKDKCSFIIGGRRSYFDLAFPLSRNPDIKKAIAYFYDLTAKVNYILDDKNRLYLSGYFGRDKFGTGGKKGFGFDWGNSTTTLRWNHLYNSKLFSNVSLIYSNYDYQLGVGDNYAGFEWKSNIINYSIKPEFNYYLNSNNSITFGLSSTYYTFDPGKLIFYSQGEKREIGDRPKYTLENAAYLGNEQKVGGLFSLQYGLRFSNFNYLGPGTAYYYRDTLANASRDTIRSQNFKSGQIIQQYNNLEPRLSVKFELTEYSSIKASYNRMAQYLHLISNTAASTPLDVWTPATNNLKPQIADQWAVGYFHNLNIKNNIFETSVEVYYKNLQNQIDYIDGANLLLNKLLEGDLLSGIGRAYGAEFYIRKTKGKLNGWISYTLSRTERKVNYINNNQWFPNRYDKPHNLNVVANYEIIKQISFSANFVYSSGTPATFPTNRIEWQGYIIPHNVDGARNNVRIPSYHRLDLSLQYDFKKKENKHYESNIVFSVYNVYARRNPFGIYFRPNGGASLITEAVRFSVIGRAIPAITYNFKF
jgi:hypothetical protein